MIVICCAMYCEAVMLINYYNLKKIEYNAFQIYEDADKSMLVVISGVGKNAASTAIGTINLKIDDWANAESERKELIDNWDNTYHLDFKPVYYI